MDKLKNLLIKYIDGIHSHDSFIVIYLMHISFVVMLFAVAGSFNKPQEDSMHIYFIFIV